MAEGSRQLHTYMRSSTERSHCVDCRQQQQQQAARQGRGAQYAVNEFWECGGLAGRTCGTQVDWQWQCSGSAACWLGSLCFPSERSNLPACLILRLRPPALPLSLSPPQPPLELRRLQQQQQQQQLQVHCSCLWTSPAQCGECCSTATHCVACPSPPSARRCGLRACRLAGAAAWQRTQGGQMQSPTRCISVHCWALFHSRCPAELRRPSSLRPGR